MKHKVYIVDDHPIVRQGLIQLINQESDMMVCGDAGDVPHAKKEIAHCLPDIAIIDLSLREASGIRLIQDLQFGYPNMRILALSMHDESIYGERCLRAGARGYIMKQEPPENVITAIRSILSGKVYLSEELRASLLDKLTARKSSPPDTPVSVLSSRELEVFQLIGQGMKTQQVADRLDISIKTIETHIEHIKRKMHFKDLHELITFAIKWTISETMV